MTRPNPMTVKALARTSRDSAQMLDHESEYIALYHAYALRFGAEPGSNVMEFAIKG